MHMITISGTCNNQAELFDLMGIKDPEIPVSVIVGNVEFIGKISEYSLTSKHEPIYLWDSYKPVEFVNLVHDYKIILNILPTGVDK